MNITGAPCLQCLDLIERNKSFGSFSVAPQFGLISHDINALTKDLQKPYSRHADTLAP